MAQNEKTNDKDIEGLRKLMAERESIIKQLTRLEKSQQNFPYDSELNRRITSKKKYLFKIDQAIKLYSFNPICTNGFIDLYNDPTSNNHYLICFHGEKNAIGKLGFGDFEYADNISYCIDEKYRNKGLGFQSVCLLLEYLNSKGINHVTIHVKKTNLPSLRIVEKLKDVYQSFSISEYESSIAVQFCIDIKKLKSNSTSL